MTDVWTAKQLANMGLPQCRVVTEEDHNKKVEELEIDLRFKVSEAHVATMGRLMGLQEAVKAVLDEELSGVRVHPCDEHSEDIKARGLPPIMRRLYEVFHGQK